ncbi:hypothetical protein SteCoe_33519 [Stentor coeruleus]|uniref:TmcB/TmcC TPR repeats domain-containing protein n=1 Tax=Stentor coeruleus TaxID=5963 RepID=A0A1R2AWQ3_9CILI|nr:hypothetical protein SteCoe_33519 [Stentor coeruleus]
MLESNIEVKESTRFLLSLKKKHSRWKKSFFTLMSEIYKKPSYQESIKVHTKYTLLLLHAITMSQLAAVIWTSDTQIKDWDRFYILWRSTQIKDWDRFYILWRSIEYLRLDPICTEFNSSKNCIIFSYAVTISCFFIGLFLLMIRVYIKKAVPKIQTLLSKLVLVNKVIFIPLLVIVTLDLKHTWNISKTSQNSNADSLNLGKAEICLSLLSLSILLSLSYSRILFDYDCRHSHLKSNLSCKSTIKPDKISFFFFFYVFLGEENFYPFRIFLIIAHIIPAAMYFIFLPYYNFSINFIKSAEHIFVSNSSLIMIIGKVYESSFFCIFGFTLLNPISLLLWYFALQYSKEKYKRMLNNQIMNALDFELIHRDNFITYQRDSLNLDIGKFSDVVKSLDPISQQLITLWESSFLFYQCEKHTLALLILNRGFHQKSFELEYQEFLLITDFYSIINENYEEYKLLSKSRKFEKVKALDKIVCLQALNFWDALVLEDTPLRTLEKLGSEFNTSLGTLKNYYENYNTIFSDSVIFLDLYSTFIQSFYGDIEKSTQLNSRKENIIRYTKYREQRSSFCFSEEDPVLIFSACNDNIGKLMYSNTASERIFQLQEDLDFCIYLEDIFPKSLNIFSINALKEFKTKIFDTTIFVNCIIPTINTEGFVIESMVIVNLLALREPFYMCVFKPISLEREILIISKFGLVENCSEGTGKLLGLNEELKNKHIEDLLNLSFADIKHSKEKELKIPGKTILAIYKKLEIKNELLRVVYIYKNEATYQEQSSDHFISKGDFKVSFALNSETDGNKNLISGRENNENIEEESLIKKNTENKESFSTSSTTLPLNEIKGFSSQSQKAIKILACIIFCSVIYIQILIIVFSNIAVMAYFWIIINIYTKQASIANLGNLFFTLSNMGDNANLIQTAAFAKLDLLSGYASIFNTSLYDLVNDINHFVEYSNGWDYCSVCKNLFTNTIPVFDYKNKVYKVDYMNIHDYIRIFIEKSKSFNKEVNDATYDFGDQTVFIEMNSFGYAYSYLEKILEALIDCRSEKSKDFRTFNTMLTILGVCIVFMCNLALIPFVIFVQNKLNSLWNRTKTNAVSSSNMMREMCLERLRIIHNYEESSDNIDEDSSILSNLKKKAKLKFDYRKKYIIRIIILLFLGSGFYLISNFAFFEPIQTSLQNRPEMLYSLIISRIKLTHLNFWSRQALVQKYKLDLKMVAGVFIPLNTDYQVNLEKSIEQVLLNVRKSLEGKYAELLGANATSEFFEESNNGIADFNYGLFPGMHSLAFDAFNIATNNNFDIISTHLKFFAKMNELSLKTKSVFNTVEKYSRNLIMGYLISYINFAILSSVFLIIASLTIFYQFLRGEIRKILCIEEVSKVIISSTVQSNEKK